MQNLHLSNKKKRSHVKRITPYLDSFNLLFAIVIIKTERITKSHFKIILFSKEMIASGPLQKIKSKTLKFGKNPVFS